MRWVLQTECWLDGWGGNVKKPGSVPSRSIRVLVMDDNVDFAEFVCEVARHNNFNATAISNPKQFEERCTAIRPEIVVLDIQMPGIDGLQLAQWLGDFMLAKQLEVRLVILSGRGEDAIQLCKSVAAISGIHEVQTLSKPVEFATLSKVLLSFAKDINC